MQLYTASTIRLVLPVTNNAKDDVSNLNLILDDLIVQLQFKIK